ncbi:hypothetical protein HBN50_02905 [Halobacteriovorax sp. GB3]|uniref:hypothetical protein n=1 Tax=Halobacteriovorax sp. GB3 TaxID=2719615 RepID=UPI002361739A|nr:hypothetical protein [Halobacteriovorax sp. GB3]MDD0852024.1 hypothetical protein [Halobacteriovorax sp. GB3]
MKKKVILLIFSVLLISSNSLASEVDELIKQSKDLVSKINTLFNDKIILEIDDKKECAKFNSFMKYRPPGYEFKNGGKYAIVCTDYLQNLTDIYTEREARDFHLFILAHETVHLLYGPSEVDNHVSHYLEQEFPSDYGNEIDSSDLQHLNIDVLAMKILRSFNLSVENYSLPFKEFAKVIGLFHTDNSLNKRLVYRDLFVKNSLNEQVSEWTQYVWSDSLCKRSGLQFGLTNLGINHKEFCFDDLTPFVKENLKGSFEDYLIGL